MTETPKVELMYLPENAEKIIEIAGRTAYASYDKIKEDSEKEFIRMIITRRHFSVLEHIVASFRISGVSRALTHQLVRHRLASYTQRSQRFVSEDNFSYIIPPNILQNQKALREFQETISHIQRTYKKLIEFGIKNEDARYILPNATTTEIVMTANLREWRHIFSLRCKPNAQWEIRKLCFIILSILKEKLPNVFFDFTLNEENYTATSKYEE